MLAKIFITLILLAVLYYAAIILYDLYFTGGKKNKNEEVIIDISEMLGEYEPLDARAVVEKESGQNRKEIPDTEDELEEYNRVKAMEEAVASMQDAMLNEEERRYIKLSQNEDDYAPINASYEYSPMEFKKIIEDNLREKDMFASVFSAAAVDDGEERI